MNDDGTTIQYQVSDDKWYKYKGVKPPERQPHGITEDQVEKLIKSTNAHAHEWIQKGNYIICRAGTNEHGHNIGVHKRLVGTNADGTPKLVKI